MTLKSVIKRVLIGEELDAEEWHLLSSWLLSQKGKEDFFEALQEDAEDLQADMSLNYDALLERLQKEIAPAQIIPTDRRIRRRLWWAASAVIAIGLFGTIYLSTIRSANEETPFSPKAVLTLADGSDIALDRNQPEVIRQEGAEIHIRDNRVNYRSKPEVDSEQHNLLSVKRGGEYTLTLEDGTVVWLNSDSRLKYPLKFTGNERRVVLEGEAFFDVSSDPDKPFIVETRNQKIEVLGTQFNVCAYTDEPTVTTLVEGSIDLTSSVTGKQHRLIPGEQVRTDPASEELIVSRVNVANIIAWTQGKFVFDDNTLEQVMRKLERWYDIQVDYMDPATKEIAFKGNLPRYVELETLLEMITKISSVQFTVKDKKVSVFFK